MEIREQIGRCLAALTQLAAESESKLVYLAAGTRPDRLIAS